MACRTCDHYLWISLNLLKRVLVYLTERISKVAGSTPRGEVCEKASAVSELIPTAATIKNSQDAVS